MAALSDIRTYAKLLLNDQNARLLTNAQVDSLISRALEEWCNYTEELWEENAYDVVAKQMWYTAPTDMIRPITAHFGPSAWAPLRIVNEHEFQESGGYHLSYGAGTPSMLIIENQGKAPVFRIWPPPTATSVTTTLTGAHTSAVTTITVAATSSFRSPAGWIKINSEKMIYQNTSATEFLLARRGEGGTTAAAHSNTDTVTELDLVVGYSRQPAAISADADVPEINIQHHYYLAYGAAAIALELDGRSPNVYMGKWEDLKRKAKIEIARRRSAAPSFIVGGGY